MEGRVAPMAGRRWVKVSREGQALVRSLLVVDPTLRPSAEDALAHPWFADAPEPAWAGAAGGSAGPSHPPTKRPLTPSGVSALDSSGGTIPEGPEAPSEKKARAHEVSI